MTKTSGRPILKLKFSNLTPLPKQGEINTITKPKEISLVIPPKKPVIVKDASSTKKANRKPILPLKSSKKLFLSKEEFVDLFVRVQEKYPKIFLAKNSPKVILAIGIHKELANGLGISMTKARKFCAIYCNQKSYKEARIPGAKRYDLEGNIVGEV